MTRTLAWLSTPLLPALLACTVGSGTSTDSADGGERVLGAEASASCEAAVDGWDALAAAQDLDSASAAYEGGPLQEYVRLSDAITERSDDAAIVAALAEGPVAAIRPMVEVALIARLRAEIAAPAALVEDPYAAWDEAYCIWGGALRDLALAAEIAGDPTYDRDIIQTIDIAFIEGHAGIDGDPPMAFIDDWVVPTARQRIEKTLFRVLHRIVLDEAKSAAADPAAARRALEYFQGLEDRLEGRNTPGIALIEGMLEGMIEGPVDVAELRTQLNIAFAKRTRKYCSDALESSTLGVPTGYTGAVEGRTYQSLITPDMKASLGAEFDADAYIVTWDAWVDAVETGDDAAATEHSATLVEWNCAYQSSLGIAECTASEDEPGA